MNHLEQARIQLIRFESELREDGLARDAVTLDLVPGHNVLTRAKRLYDLVGGADAGYEIVIWIAGEVFTTEWATCEGIL